MDIGERPILRLPNVTLLQPTRFPGEVRTVEDRPDFAWGLCFRYIILQSFPLVIDVILELPTTNELLNLVFEGDALLGGVTDVFMEPTVLVLVPFGVVSMQRVRPLEYSRLLCCHEKIFS